MDLEYDEKFAEMKKYIPFLENMIQKLEYAGSGGPNPREAQLRKIKSLRNLLLDHSKKMKMENLRKCEQVLINLYAKVEQNDTLPGVSKTLPDVRIHSAMNQEMELRSVRERLQQAVISQDHDDNRQQLMSVCHKVEKEPALFQRRPSKPSTASSGEDASSDPLSKRKYTRLLVSPERNEQNWSDSENPLYHRRAPKKSPRKRSPKREKKGLYKRDRNKNRDCEEINITLNVPKKTLSSLNTEDILDRIISCQNNDIDIDQLSSLRSQIIQELKHTGGNQDISDFILKSYKKKNKHKKDDIEEGELSDSESESIEKVYGNLVIELKNDLNDNEDQNNVDFFSSRSNNDENNTQKIKITLVSSNPEIESKLKNTEINYDKSDNKNETVHCEELVPHEKSKSSDYLQQNDISLVAYAPTDSKDSHSNKDNQGLKPIDVEKNNQINLANFYVPLSQDITLTNYTSDKSKNNTLIEAQEDCKPNLAVSDKETTESQEKGLCSGADNKNNSNGQTECHKSYDNQNKNKETTELNITSHDKQFDNNATKSENNLSEDIPFISNDSKKPQDTKNNIEISEIDILKALKNEILSESIDVPNTSNTPALHLPKITKVTDKNILDTNKKKRISLEKYKEKSISTTKTPLFVNDPNIKLQDDQPKKQSRGLTEKECDRFKFFASCLLSSDEESDCKDINDIIYSNLTPNSPEPKETTKSTPKIVKEIKEQAINVNSDDVDMRATPTISSVSTLYEPKRKLSIDEHSNMVSPASISPKINENVIPKDPRKSLKETQNVQKAKDPRKPLAKSSIPSKTKETSNKLTSNQKTKNDSNTSNQYFSKSETPKPHLLPNPSYGRMDCPTTPSHPFGQSDWQSDCPRTPNHPFGRSDFPTTSSYSFGRSDCPTTPNHPFGRSDCPTTPSHPFGRSDCPTTPSHPFGRSDCPTTPNHPFGRSDCPTTPSHPFGRSDCPTTPSHQFGRSDCPTTPSHPFGRSDGSTTPSHPFGRSDCSTTSSHPFGRSNCPTTPSHPFGRSECPRTPSHPFGRSDCAQTNHYGRSERPVTPNPYSQYERSTTPSRSISRLDCPNTPSHPFGRSECSETSSHLFGRSDRSDTISHKYGYSDGPLKPNYNFGRSEHYSRNSNDQTEHTPSNSFNLSDRSNSAYRHTNNYDNSNFSSNYLKYKNNEDTTKSLRQYPHDRSFSQERNVNQNLRRELSIPRQMQNEACREKSVPRREQSVSRREQSVPRSEQSSPYREQSVPRREQSMPRREQSVPRREQSLPRREQSIPRQNTMSRKDFASEYSGRKESIFRSFQKEDPTDFTSDSLAIGFDIDTSVSRTFQNTTFEDRRRRASSVGRFDTDNSRSNQSPKTIDNFQHFRSNFTRARSVGRDFNKQSNTSPKIDFDFKNYKTKTSEQSNKAYSLNKEKYNSKKQETFNMRDPRNRKETNSMKVRIDKNNKSNSTKDYYHNRDPRLNRHHKESPNKYNSSRYTKERRYETERKYGIVYTNDNIAKGNILGPGYGVKNYKIPKIKRAEEEKIDTPSMPLMKVVDNLKNQTDTTETKKSKNILSEDGKEKFTEKSKVLTEKSKQITAKSTDILFENEKGKLTEKSKEVEKSENILPKKMNDKVSDVKKRELITVNSKGKSSENTNIHKISHEKHENNFKDKQNYDLENAFQNISNKSLKNIQLNEDIQLTETPQDETKINALKEVNDNNDDDKPICTRTRRRRKTLLSETDSENNMEILESTPLLTIENTSDIDNENKANNSFDSKDLDLFSDTDKETAVIDNIIANLDKEIDDSKPESKSSYLGTSNNSLKVLDTLSLPTKETDLTSESMIKEPLEQNTLDTIDKKDEDTYIKSTSNVTEKNVDSNKDENKDMFSETKINEDKFDVLLQTSLETTELPVSIPNNKSINSVPNKIVSVCDKNLEDATVSTSNLTNEPLEPSNSCISKILTVNITKENFSLISPSPFATKTNDQEITSISKIENEVQNITIEDNRYNANNLNSGDQPENITNILPDSTNELPTDPDIPLRNKRDNNESKKPTSDESKLKVESLGNLLSILQDKSKIKELLNMINESTESEKIKRKLEKLTTIVSDDEEILDETEEQKQCNKDTSDQINDTNHKTQDKSNVIQYKSNETEGKDNETPDKINEDAETNLNNIDITEINIIKDLQPKPKKEIIKKKVIKKKNVSKRRRKKCAGKIAKVKNTGAVDKRVTRSGTLSAAVPKPKKLKRELLMLQEDLKEVFSHSDSLVNPSGLRQCRLTKLVNENNKANKRDTEESKLRNYNTEETIDDIGEKKIVEKPTRKKPGPKPKSKLCLNVSRSEDQDKVACKIKPGLKGKKRTESSEMDPYEFEVDNFSESSKTGGSPYSSEDEFLNKSFESSNSSKKSRVRRKNTPWQLGVIPKKYRKKKVESEKMISKEESIINENEIFVDKTYCFKKGEINYNCKFCPYEGNEIVNHFKKNHPHYEVPLSRFDTETSNAAIQQSLVTDFKKLQYIVTEKQVCRFCFEVFENKVNNLKAFFAHVISKHTGEYAQKCSQCENYKHCTYTLDVPPVPKDGLLLGFICGECNYTQLSLENLKTHVALRHDNEQTAVYAIDIGDMTESKFRMLAAKTKKISSEDDLPMTSLKSSASSNRKIENVDRTLNKNLKSKKQKPCPASKKKQPKSTFENEESTETENTVIKKEIMSNEKNSISVPENSDEKSVDDVISPDPIQIPAASFVNRDKCATENLFTDAHFKVNITKNGIKEYVCCINDNIHYKTTLLISIKKHVQLRHKEIWDGYCYLCKVIVTPQGKHYFKDCWSHILEKHLDDLPLLEITEPTESLPELIDATDKAVNNINKQSPEMAEPTKTYINVRPMFELMANVSETTTEDNSDNNADSMAFPRIESVISLNSKDLNVEATEETPDSEVFESLQNKVAELKQQMDLDAAQIQIFKEKHRVVIDTMLTPDKLVQYFKCAGSFCSFTCDSPEAAIVHVTSHQRLGGAGALKCAYCALQVDNGIDLVSHVFHEHGHCQYSCSKCFYRTVSGSYVESHVQRIHKTARLQGSVLKAPALAPGSQIPSDQGKPLHTDVVPQYKCFKTVSEGTCKFRHYTQDKYVEHLQHKHQTDTTFECSYCPEKHESVQSLLKHLQSHDINVYQCTWCVHGTSSKAAMMDHVSTRHPTIRVNPYIRRIVQKNEKAMRILPVVNIDKMTTTAVEVNASPSQDAPVKEVERAIQLENLIGATNKMIGHDLTPKPSTPTPLIPTPTPVSDRTPTPDPIEENDHLLEPPATPPPADSIQEQTTPVLVTERTPEKTPPERIITPEPVDSKRNIVTTALIDIPSSSVVVDLTDDEPPPVVAPDNLRLPTDKLFVCGNCRQHLRTAAAYKRHVVSVCKDIVLGKIRCAYCSYTNENRTEMVTHYVSEHGQTLCYICSMCQREELEAKVINKHMADEHDVVKVKSQAKLWKGVRKYVVYPLAMKKPAPKRKVSGEYAKKTYGPGDADGLPINPIMDEDVFCSVCDFRTKVRLNMVRHLAQHRDRLPVGTTAPVNPVPHLDSNEMHFDKMANLASSSLQPARPTGRIEPVAEPARYPQYVPDRTRLACGASGCGYISVDEATLKAHWDALHAGADTFRCVHCPSTQQLSASVTLTAARIVAHLRMHDTRLYACPHCSYYHNVRHVVEKHLRERHAQPADRVVVVREVGTAPFAATTAPTMDLKPWQCGLCRYSSMLRSAVVDHCWNSHKSKTQLKCALCAFRSSERSKLDEHMTETHPGRTGEPLYYFYREGSLPDEPDGTLRWQKQAKDYPETARKPDEEPVIKPCASPPPPLAAPAVDLNLVKSEVSEEADISESGLKASFGEFCEPKGNKFACPLCTTATLENKEAMTSHLYEELNYRKWSCGLCTYKGFHRNGLMEHALFEHRRTYDPIALPPDVRIEKWVSSLIHYQELAMLKPKENPPPEPSKKPVGPNKPSEGLNSTISESSIDYPQELLEKSFGVFGKSTRQEFACPKCDYTVADEANMTDHLETELAKVRWICGICSQKFQTYHQVQLHAKCVHSGQTVKIVEASRDPSLRAAWIASVLRSQRTHIRGQTTEAEVPREDNSLLVVRYEETVRTPDATTDQPRDQDRHSDNESDEEEDDQSSDSEPSTKKIRKHCKYCIYSTKFARCLHLHMYKHYNLKPFRCRYCDHTAWNRTLIKGHLIKKHMGMQMLYDLTEIPSNATLSVEIIKPGVYVGGGLTNPECDIVCLVCENAFRREDILEHMESQHETQPARYAEKKTSVLKCCSCLTLWQDKESLVKHHNEEHRYEKLRYLLFNLIYGIRQPCACCPRKFRRIRDLKDHHELMHRDQMYVSPDVITESAPAFPVKRPLKKDAFELPVPKKTARKSTTKLPG